MKTPFLLAAAALCLAVPASARAQQAPANPVTAVIKELFDRQSQFMIDAAKEMPAEKYGYQPTAPQMTFGKIVSHVIGANAAVCRMIADTPAPPTMRAADTDPKEKLVSTLQASFEFCAQALPKLQDSKMGIPSPSSATRKPHGPAPRSSWLPTWPITIRRWRATCDSTTWCRRRRSPRNRGLILFPRVFCDVRETSGSGLLL